MIKNKITDKLVLVAGIVVLIGAILFQGSALGTSPTTSNLTQYATELFGDSIITLDIQADQSDWEAMIANAQAKTYIMADVVVNGVTYQDVGVRTKGNASLTQVSQSASPERYSLRIKFDEYIEGQTLLGLDELVLNNMISDPSYMKEYLSQDLMRFIGVEAPLTNYASLSVNGEGIGFYVTLESYGSSYNLRVNGDKDSNYYNVKTMEMGGGNGMPQERGFAFGQQGDLADQQGPATEDWEDRQGFVGRGGGSRGGSLEYSDDDPESYPSIFDNALQNVTLAEQQNVIDALKALSTGENIENYINVDQVLRYFAAHTFLVSMDSYYSNMAQNYVIQERDGVISILPWDYHLSYGGFQSGSASEIVNAPIDTPLSGVTMESRPLLNALLSNEEYVSQYHQYLQKMVTEYFEGGLFEKTVRNLQNKIASYVETDPTAFYNINDFNQAVETLIDFNLLRAESIAGQLDGTIPATTEGQSIDSSTLIDASSIDMSDLGSSGMGGGGGARPEGDIGEFPGAMPEGGMGESTIDPMQGMPDQDLMRQAMEIVQAAEGELTDEVKEKLLALGITEDQLAFFENSQGGFPMGGGMPGQGIPQDGQAPPGLSQPNQTPPEITEESTTAPASNMTNPFSTNFVWIGVLGAILAVAIIVIAKYKRSY